MIPIAGGALCTPLERIVLIAAVCHEANRALCAAHGDHSHEPWHRAPAWQRESAILGVQRIAHGEITRPEQSHDSWMEHKLRDGWRYGPTKNPETKEHPCLVPFAELSALDQAKDHVFFAIASALLMYSGPAAETEPAAPLQAAHGG